MLIGQDYGTVFPSPYNVRDNLHLPHGRRDADNFHRRPAKPTYIPAVSLRELPDIVLHKERRPVVPVRYHITGIIPAEFSHRCIPHLPHQLLLAFIQCIEPREHETVNFRKNFLKHISHRSLIQFRDYTPVDHTLISQTPVPQGLTEHPIQRFKQIPYLEEPRLDIRPGRTDISRKPGCPFVEMTDKPLYGLALPFGKIGIAVIKS